MDRSRYYNYNFTRFEDACDSFLHRQSDANLKAIQVELNKFFSDSTCTEIIYTINRNNFFFGMAVSPNVDVAQVLHGENEIRIDSYSLEIDSKLLELKLTSSELVAVLLHEIGHLVNDTSPTREVRKEIDRYLAKHREVIIPKETLPFADFFRLGICDAYRKVNSIFTRNNEEVLADEFVLACGYGEELQSMFEKLLKSSGTINRGVPNNEFIVLLFTLEMYANIKHTRLRSIQILNHAKENTASVIEKREATKAIYQLTNETVTEAVTVFGYSKLNESIIQRIAQKGLRGVQDDVYEYKLRVNNIETEEDALYLMRQIQSRMAIIQDYMRENPESPECIALSKTLSQYEDIRQQLSNKTVYNRKHYGIWTDYNLLTSEDY